MDSIINLIIALIGGGVGGNVAGAALPEKTLGTLGNTIAGLIGGGAGNFLLTALGVLASTKTPGASELDLSSILASLGVGGVSGGALTAIIALIKDALQKK